MANQQCGSKNKGFHLTRLAAMLPLAIVASGCGVVQVVYLQRCLL